MRPARKSKRFSRVPSGLSGARRPPTQPLPASRPLVQRPVRQPSDLRSRIHRPSITRPPGARRTERPQRRRSRPRTTQCRCRHQEPKSHRGSTRCLTQVQAAALERSRYRRPKVRPPKASLRPPTSVVLLLRRRTNPEGPRSCRRRLYHCPALLPSRSPPPPPPEPTDHLVRSPPPHPTSCPQPRARLPQPRARLPQPRACLPPPPARQ